MTQTFRIIGEKKSDLAPEFGPELAGLLALTFNPRPAFPATLRRHPLTAHELREILTNTPAEDRKPLGEELLALEKVHGPTYYIELVE